MNTTAIRHQHEDASASLDAHDPVVEDVKEGDEDNIEDPISDYRSLEAAAAASYKSGDYEAAKDLCLQALGVIPDNENPCTLSLTYTLCVLNSDQADASRRVWPILTKTIRAMAKHWRSTTGFTSKFLLD